VWEKILLASNGWSVCGTKYPTMFSSTPTTSSHPVPNSSSAEVEKYLSKWRLKDECKLVALEELVMMKSYLKENICYGGGWCLNNGQVTSESKSILSLVLRRLFLTMVNLF
jgi:hypothetical protein